MNPRKNNNFHRQCRNSMVMLRQMLLPFSTFSLSQINTVSLLPSMTGWIVGPFGWSLFRAWMSAHWSKESNPFIKNARVWNMTQLHSPTFTSNNSALSLSFLPPRGVLNLWKEFTHHLTQSTEIMRLIASWHFSSVISSFHPIGRSWKTATFSRILKKTGIQHARISKFSLAC